MSMENIKPTRMNLLSRRGQIKLANDGLAILRGKREALLKELVRRATLLKNKQMKMQKLSHDANAELAMARAVRGTSEVASLIGPGQRSLQLPVHYETIWGLSLGNITCQGLVRSMEERGVSQVDYSTHISDAAVAAELLVEQLLECAPLEMQIKALGEEVRRLGRRINAIDEYLIPRLKTEIDAITRVLDEREREERFRLKRVKRKKNRDNEENSQDAAE